MVVIQISSPKDSLNVQRVKISSRMERLKLSMQVLGAMTLKRTLSNGSFWEQEFRSLLADEFAKSFPDLYQENGYDLPS